jgi:hypothetical protein
MPAMLHKVLGQAPHMLQNNMLTSAYLFPPADDALAGAAGTSMTVMAWATSSPWGIWGRATQTMTLTGHSLLSSKLS